ncbi:hypothetical protein MC7420_722 [Coleofasciculus chthonoplastes PCC 7420]|uniref:Uncharacterized protein n=1 Tax=Coleofasciculus chthonoplastes PCC 7420 TaxID=118168 RepID=B4VSW7_9CYAN|nr:hypothetical protein MC7420_722 [Coleofasciculus chthonoplastes PCC 7420]
MRQETIVVKPAPTNITRHALKQSEGSKLKPSPPSPQYS